MPKLMDVLEFVDPTGQIMVKRLPEGGEFEIKWGSQLTVRESQTAVFFRDGKSLDVFGAGRHILQTQNIPLITKMFTRLGYGKDSPFRAEVYFVNMKLFRNLKWGTSEPIPLYDSELKWIKLRSFGIYSIEISEPSLFLNKVVGTQGIFIDTEIEDYLKNIIVTKFTDILGENATSIFELPKMYNELSLMVKNSVQADFEGLGLKIHDLLINSISPPPEIQKMIDERIGMEAVGDMDKYLKYKAATAMQSAAENESAGGTAAAGVGMGAGMGMGFMMPQMLQGAMQANQGGGGEANKSDSAIDKIKKLKELFDMGAISEEEFNSKKKDLMNEI